MKTSTWKKLLVMCMAVLLCSFSILVQTEAAAHNPFTDVAQTSFCFTPVLWALENNVTSGTSATTFEPNASCTRGQVVTFLWRAQGSPEPKSSLNPFVDVSSKAFYYKAVLWAVENGVTAGTSATTFGPDEPCTRGQVVTFLYRAMGEPAVRAQGHRFTDVSSSGFYYTPMLWAVENGVTSGTSATTFEPNSTCTRGQVVTFLYRTLVEKHAGSQQNSIIKAYLPYVQNAITHSAYDFYEGSGILYDMDDDGIEELIITNMYDEVDGKRAPTLALSIYDIENGQVQVKCDKYVMYLAAGSPKGHAAVAGYNGKQYVAVYIDNGGTSYGAGRERVYSLYDFQSLQAVLTTTLDYNIGTDQVNGCAVNGISCTYDTYTEIMGQIEELIVAEGASNDASDGSMGLPALAAYLQSLS